MDKRDFIERIKLGIQKLEPEAEIYLFGSRARGDFHEDSDWDILLVAPRNSISFDYEMKIREPILDLELETGQVISLLVYSKKEWLKKKAISSLYNSVVEEGILVN